MQPGRTAARKGGEELERAAGSSWSRSCGAVEVGVGAIYVLLNLSQLVIGYSTIKRLIAKAMADFHLQPIDPDEAAVNDRL